MEIERNQTVTFTVRLTSEEFHLIRLALENAGDEKIGTKEQENKIAEMCNSFEEAQKGL